MLHKFLCFIFVFLFFHNNVLANFNQKKIVKAPEIPLEGLKGVGINTMAYWTGTSNTYDVERFINHIKPLEKFGFSHVVIISCADWIIDLSCNKSFQDYDNIIAATKAAIEKTSLHVVLSLKAYKQKKISGKNTSSLQQKLENDINTQIKFIETWKKIANVFSNVSRERLSFNLLNEPEFELPKVSFKKRKLWEEIASKAIKEIRTISPNRVIIYEGIGKSLIASRNKSGYGKYRYGFPDLIAPLPFKDIVYGFHNYQPEYFLQQAKYRSGYVGKPYNENITKAVKKDASKISNWAKDKNVPVIMSEVGCIGYVDGKTEGPKNPEDCGKYAQDLYKFYVLNNIPITWWALEKEKTIYKRAIKGDKNFLPFDLIPDNHLFKGLRLNLN